MGPHVSDSGGVKLGSNRVKRGQTRRRLDAGEARDGGAARKTPTGHGRGRSLAHWKALAGARRVVVAAGPMVAGADDSELQGGGWSSGNDGFGAAVHGRRSWLELRAPGSALSAVTRSVWTEADQNNDGDKSGAGEVSVSTETRATMS